MSAPKRFSAYYVTWSNVESIPQGEVLIDKGHDLRRDWTVVDFTTEETTGAVGERIARLCPTCKVQYRQLGVLDHGGDCGSPEVKEAAAQLVRDLKAERAAAAAS